MHFYALLFSQGWQICSAWVASYSLVSKIVFGAFFATGGVIAESVLWPQDSKVSRRVGRLIVSAVVGPAAVLAGMYLISLFYYAPGAVLTTVAIEAANDSRSATKRENESERTTLTKAIAGLREEIKNAPCSRDLAEVEGERNDALEQAENAEHLVDRIEKAADELTKAESEYDQAINLQRDEWTVLTTDWMTMVDRPGVSYNDAMAELRVYELRKAQMETAQTKLRDSATTLHELLLAR